MDYDLVVGIDPGTIHQGFAYANHGGYSFGHIALKGLNRQTPFEVFFQRLDAWPDFQSLLLAIKEARNVAAFIEQPDRWVTQKVICRGYDEPEQRRFQEQVATFWRRLILISNPDAQVIKINSLTWQRKLLVDSQRQGKSFYKFEALRVASNIVGQPMINVHAADAVCLTNYGIIHHFVNNRLVAPSH